MKKTLLIFLCLLLLAGLCVPAFAAEDFGTVNYCMVEIIVDGAKIVPKDAAGNLVEPFIYNGTTYLPVRSVANALGLGVDWESGLVKLTSGAGRTAPVGEPLVTRREVTLPMGGQDTIVTLDGTALELKDGTGKPVAPIISGGVTYLPVRAIADALDVPVYWDADNARVYLGKRIEWLLSKQTYIEKTGSTTTTTYTYDAYGNILTETTVYPSYTEKETYTYDERGNVLTETYQNNDWEQPVSYSYAYTYDDNGNVLTGRYTDPTDPDSNYTETHTYDAQGRETSETVIYDNGFRYVYTTTYNTQGNVIAEHYQGDDYCSEHTYTYNERGDVLTEKTVFDDGRSHETVYTYDSQGNTLTDKTVYSNGNYSSTVSTYDNDGQLLSRTYETQVNGASSRSAYAYTYDADGNILTSVFETADQEGSSREDTRYTYDGNTVTETVTRDGVTRIYTYVYDDFENLLDWSCVSDGKKSQSVYHYDDGGKLLSISTTDGTGNVSQITYRYDAWGNQVEYAATYSVTLYEYIAREW